MKYGIAALSIIAMRKEPVHCSELVSQLLFGELYEVTKEQGNWLCIKSGFDSYEGWIDKNQHEDINEKDFQFLNAGNGNGLAIDLVSNATSSKHAIPIVAGSSLPFFDGLNFKVGKEKFIYNGQAILAEGLNTALLERIALRYLNAPYLWGGRSPFGIDCSGFTQVVFKLVGIRLKRDAYQQAEQGNILNFIEETQVGDLAFFGNEEGKIIHVGIILKDNKIIHASGKVRIDRIDHFGIFNTDIKKYSHQLKVLKRIL